MPRIQRRTSPSNIYHVIIRGNEKKNIFFDDEDRGKFIHILKMKKSDNNFELYAYCLMDNHVHLIINERSSSIARIMKCINISYAIYFNKKYDRIGHLFQDRFRSEIIDGDRYLLAVIRYVHNNPIKANMVRKLNEYKWSSYNSYINAVSRDGLTDCEFVLGMFSNNRIKAMENFIKFSLELDDTEFLDINENKGIDTRQKALALIASFLNNKGIVHKDILSQRGKSIRALKKELVLKLMEDSDWGCREIGKLLGMSKSTVHRLGNNRK